MFEEFKKGLGNTLGVIAAMIVAGGIAIIAAKSTYVDETNGSEESNEEEELKNYFEETDAE